MKTIFVKTILFLFLLALGFIGCTKDEPAKKARKAVAVVNATTGNQANGTVTFTETENGIQVTANFDGVPEGEHGFHIHEFGDCSSGDGKSAGGHFNPEGVAHAGPSDETRHVGDLGNVTADASGKVSKSFVDQHIAFEGLKSIVGKGVILHAGTDDLTSQPTGAAGARIACGVIKLSEE